MLFQKYNEYLTNLVLDYEHVLGNLFDEEYKNDTYKLNIVPKTVP